MSSEPVITQFFRGTNFDARTGRSHTSKDLTKVWFSWFQTWTLPLYSEANIHGSVGCKSQHFTRSLRAVNRLLMSSLKGCKNSFYNIFFWWFWTIRNLPFWSNVDYVPWMTISCDLASFWMTGQMNLPGKHCIWRGYQQQAEIGLNWLSRLSVFFWSSFHQVQFSVKCTVHEFPKLNWK